MNMGIYHLFLREEESFHQLRLHSAALLQVEHFCHSFLSGRFTRCATPSVVFTSKGIVTSTTDAVPPFVLEAEGLLLQPHTGPSVSRYWRSEFAPMGRVTLLKYKERTKIERGSTNNMPAVIYSEHFFSFWIGFLPYVNTAFVVFVFHSVLRNKLPFEDFDGDKFSTFPVSKTFPLVQ